MSDALKGVIAGFVATLVLTGLMMVNSTIGLMPQIDIIRLLTTLGTLTTASAWMDHFIVGVVVWGLLFAAIDATTARKAFWMKGMIFGVFAWLRCPKCSKSGFVDLSDEVRGWSVEFPPGLLLRKSSRCLRFNAPHA